MASTSSTSSVNWNRAPRFAGRHRGRPDELARLPDDEQIDERVPELEDRGVRILEVDGEVEYVLVELLCRGQILNEQRDRGDAFRPGIHIHLLSWRCVE